MPETNPFFNAQELHSFELSPPPFMSAGDAAVLHQAKITSGWFKELAFVGSDAAIDDIVGRHGLLHMPEAMSQFAIDMPDLDLPTFSEGIVSPRQLVVGMAAVYGWEDPGF